MVTNANDKKAIEMAKKILAFAGKKAKSGSVSREIAYAMIFTRRANTTIADVLKYRNARERLQRFGLKSELGIDKEEDLKSDALLEARGKLIREAGRLYDEATVTGIDPFTVLEKESRIDEIVWNSGFLPKNIGLSYNKIEDLFVVSYDAIEGIGLDEIMARYEKGK